MYSMRNVAALILKKISKQIKSGTRLMSHDMRKPTMSPSVTRGLRSNQPSLRMKKCWVLSYSLSAQQRLWSDWVIRVFGGRTLILLVRHVMDNFNVFVYTITGGKGRCNCRIEENYIYILHLKVWGWGWG